MNRWGIPDDLEKLIRERDIVCVYCGTQMVEFVPRGAPRKNVATWEHILNDITIITPQNIARCCNSCNASKGAKALRDWLNSNYCRRKRISITTVAAVVKEYLASSDDAHSLTFSGNNPQYGLTPEIRLD